MQRACDHSSARKRQLIYMYWHAVTSLQKEKKKIFSVNNRWNYLATKCCAVLRYYHLWIFYVAIIMPPVSGFRETDRKTPCSPQPLIVSLCDSIYLYKPSRCFFLGEPFAFSELHCSTHGPVQIVPFYHVFAHITFFLSWILVSLFSAHLNGLFSDSSQFLKTLSLFCIILFLYLFY